MRELPPSLPHCTGTSVSPRPRVCTRVPLSQALHTPPAHCPKAPPGAAPWTQQCEALSFPFLIKNENGRKKNVQLV